MVWCDACVYASTSPPTEVKVRVVRQGEDAAPGGIDEVVVPEEVARDKQRLEELTRRRMEMLQSVYAGLRARYDDVIWCTRRRTFVVRKRGHRPAEADATACPFFKPKS